MGRGEKVDKKNKGTPSKVDKKAKLPADSPATKSSATSKAGTVRHREKGNSAANLNNVTPSAAITVAQGKEEAGSAGAIPENSAAGRHEGLGANKAVLQKLINQADFADVQVTTPGKGNLNAHEFILIQRCPELAKLCKKGRKGTVADITIHKLIDHDTMSRTLQFIYTDNFEFGKLSDNDVIHLNAAATIFKLQRLNWLCAAQLQKTMSMTNIYDIMKKATADAQADVKNLAIGFIMQNYQQFIQSKTGVSNLGVELFTDLVQMHEIGSFESPDLGDEPPVTIDDDFRNIFNKMPASDLTNVVGNKKTIKAHRAIVGNFSAKLHAHCSQAKPGDPFPSATKNKKPLPLLTEGAATALLKWMYYGEGVEDGLIACELIPFAQEFGLPALWAMCEKTALANVDVPTALRVLDVAYLDHMKEHPDVVKSMKVSATTFVLENLPAIDLSVLKSMDAVIARDILLEEQRRQKAGIFGVSGSAAASASAPDRAASTSEVEPERSQSQGSVNSHAHKSEAKESSKSAEDFQASTRDSAVDATAVNADAKSSKDVTTRDSGASEDDDHSAVIDETTDGHSSTEKDAAPAENGETDPAENGKPRQGDDVPSLPSESDHEGEDNVKVANDESPALAGSADSDHEAPARDDVSSDKAEPVQVTAEQASSKKSERTSKASKKAKASKKSKKQRATE